MSPIADPSPLLEALRHAHLLRSSAPSLTVLPGGVSSEITLVEDGGAQFVVKQALQKLRVKDDWFASTARNQVERRFFEYAATILPEATPRILASDPRGGWFAMDYFGADFAPWKQQLLQGVASARTAQQVGRILGTLHRASWNDSFVGWRFDTLPNFRELRLHPYFLATAERMPEVAPELVKEAERLACTRLALVHGDFSPKNLLVGGDRVVVLDAECAWFGDPAFDAAFLLNHLYLKSALRADRPEAILSLVPAFWSAYCGELGAHADAALEARTAFLVACLMLARLHGRSPVEYLEAPSQRKLVSDFAVRHVRHRPLRLSALMEDWRTALSAP